MANVTDVYSPRNFSVMQDRNADGRSAGIKMTIGDHDFWLLTSAAADLILHLQIAVDANRREYGCKLTR